MTNERKTIDNYLQGAIPIKFLGDNRLCTILIAAVIRRLDTNRNDLKKSLLSLLRNKNNLQQEGWLKIRNDVVSLFDEVDRENQIIKRQRREASLRLVKQNHM